MRAPLQVHPLQSPKTDMRSIINNTNANFFTQGHPINPIYNPVLGKSGLAVRGCMIRRVPLAHDIDQMTQCWSEEDMYVVLCKREHTSRLVAAWSVRRCSGRARIGGEVGQAIWRGRVVQDRLLSRAQSLVFGKDQLYLFGS
jgi:hypothetical protein